MPDNEPHVHIHAQPQGVKAYATLETVDDWPDIVVSQSIICFSGYLKDLLMAPAKRYGRWRVWTTWSRRKRVRRLCELCLGEMLAPFFDFSDQTGLTGELELLLVRSTLTVLVADVRDWDKRGSKLTLETASLVERLANVIESDDVRESFRSVTAR